MVELAVRANMDFANPLVQAQWRVAVLRQLDEVVKKNGAPVDLKHPLIASLLAGLQSPSIHTTLTCSTTLTTVVTHRWVESDSLISTLVSATIITPHPIHTIHTIAEVMVHQCGLLSADRPMCPYSLRVNVHPFISLLNTLPEIGLCLVNEVVGMLSSNCGVSVLAMMEPFIKAVLLQPTPSPHTTTIFTHLLNNLVDVAKQWITSSGQKEQRATSSLVSLLVRILPLCPAQSTRDLLSLISMATKVAQLVEVTKVSYDFMIESCLSLISEITNRGLPSAQLVESICSLAEKVDVLGSTCHTLAISGLLFKSLPLPQTVHGLLKLCALLSIKVTTSAFLFVLPLVQLLSYLTTKSCDLTLTNQKTAADILAHIQEIPLNEHECCETTPNFSEVHSLAELYNILCSDLTKIAPFLKSLQEHYLKGLQSYEHLCVMLCGLAVMVVRSVENATDVRSVSGVECVRLILSTLTSIAQYNQTLGPSLLPFFIHLLSQSSSPYLKLLILHFFPHLATHKLTTSSVQNTILTIGGNPSLVSMATRLFGWMWEKQDRVFSSLLEYITRPLPSVSTGIQIEIELARVSVVRDVCFKSAELHGETILSVINCFIGSHDPVVVAMAIEGLGELCRREVVDVVTLWGVIEERLVRESRPAVMMSLCSLFGLAADIPETDKHSHKVFKHKALKYLFSSVMSGHPTVCSAALKSLSLFQMIDLPSTALQSHDRPSESQDHLPVTGAQLVDWFWNIPKESYSDHAHFLSVMLGQEIESIGRGTISKALTQSQAATQTDKVLDMITTSLLQTSTEAHRDWLTIAVAMCHGDVKVRSSPPGRQVAQQLLSEQLSLMEEALCVSVFHEESDWCEGVIRLETGQNWKKFMNGLLSSYTKVFLNDQRLVSTEEVGVASETSLRAHHWAVSQALERLEKFARGHSDSAGNVLIALVGMVSSSISYLIGQLDHVTSINQSEAFTILWELLEALIELVSPETSTALTSSTRHTTLTAVMCGDNDQLRVCAWYALPVLVEVCTGMCVEGWGQRLELEVRLLTLTEGILASFHSSTDWYVPEVVDQILFQLLPLFSQVTLSLNKLLEELLKDDSIESLCRLSALLPSLSLSGGGSAVQTVMTSLTQALSNLSSEVLSSATAKLCWSHLTSGLVVEYYSGSLSEDTAMSLVRLVADAATKAPQEAAYTLCLGTALHGLADKGHPQAVTLSDALAVRWLKELEDVSDTLQQSQFYPLLWGLSALLGVPTGLHPIRIISGGHTSYLRTLCPLVVQIFNKVRSAFSGESVSSTTMWLLYRIREYLLDYFGTLEKVPQDYGYLPQSSLLSSLYGLLEGYQGDSMSRQLVTALIDTLCQCEAEIAPCNWSHLIIPCLRQGLGCDECETKGTITTCVKRKMCFKQLTYYLAHPLILNRLKPEMQCVLLDALPHLVRALPSPSLGVFLHYIITASHLHTSSPSHLHTLTPPQLLHLLQGLRKAFANSDLLPVKKQVLSVCVERVHKMLLSSDWSLCKELLNGCLVKEGMLLWEVAACLHELDTKESLGAATANDVTLEGCYAAAIKCCLAMQGLTLFMTLGCVVGWTLQNTGDVRMVSSSLLLLRTISICCSPTLTANAFTLNQMDALHMLLSWTRENKVSSKQMRMILLLAHVAVSNHSTTKSLTALLSSVHQTTELEGSAWGVLQAEWVEPQSPAVRKKLCECLVEWLGQMSADPQLKKILLGIFSKLKGCAEYQAPLIWTSVGHLL